MKFLFSLVLIISAPLVAATQDVPVLDVFVPSGFDDNDIVEVVVYGYLPTPCYQSPKAEVAVNGKDITIATVASLEQSGNCPTVTVPYSIVVPLGKLSPETYNIVAGTERRQKPLKIAAAPSVAGDNFYYANVEKVWVSKNNQVVKLLVRDMSSCLVYDRMATLENGMDVISLMPIFEFNYSECTPRNEEKFLTFDVPKEYHQKTTLVHIRSMNGHSKNVILNSRAPFPR